MRKATRLTTTDLTTDLSCTMFSGPGNSKALTKLQPSLKVVTEALPHMSIVCQNFYDRGLGNAFSYAHVMMCEGRCGRTIKERQLLEEILHIVHLTNCWDTSWQC